MKLVVAGAALVPHANNAFNAIKSAHIPKEHLHAAAAFANQAAVGAGKLPFDACSEGFIGSAASGMQAGIGNVAAGSVFAGLQSAGVLGFGPGVCAAATGLGGVPGHVFDELTKKKRKL
jgi:hypothetical protein